MRYFNASMTALRRALRRTNRKYDGNLIFVRLDEAQFTLGTREVLGPGARRGSRKADGSRRLLPGKACWHAHGHFFEALFHEEPNAIVTSSLGRITGPGKTDGNWQDRPVVDDDAHFSDLCECARDTLHPHTRARKTVGKVVECRPEGLIGRRAE